MAAGLGFKTFTTGEVLTASDVNGYLMQGVLVFASAAARNSAITLPQEGQFAYTKDTNSLWYYDGAAWVASGATGDIEGVTAGVGISGGGTSGTVTVTNSMATAIDAKGDLVAGTGADAFSRLGVGANNTVLTADSAEATGLKWATPAGATESYTQVYSASLPAAASVTISSLTGDKIRCYITSASSTDASATYRLRPNSNSTAANYNKGLTGVQYSQAGNATYPTYTAGSGNGFDLANGSNAASDSAIIYFEIDACKSTGIKTVKSYSWVSGTGGYGWITGGIYEQAAAVTSIQILSSTGNFDAGTITVWESAV
jgi:hypothetical protein